MDTCHLKNAELETKHLKYKGRVVLRGDIVKDDSGSYAVFTKLGSSASQMTAAKVMDIISRLPGCAGQAADAVSAKTQVKMEDAPKLRKNPNSECPDIWIRLPKHKWPKSWSSMEDPVVPLERNLYGHLWAGLLWERQFEKILLKYGCEKVSNWECLFVHREQGLFWSVHVDDIKLAGKKKISIRCGWKVRNKEVDLGEPTYFLDHVHLGCTQRHCEISKDFVDNYSTMFESRISAGATEKLPCLENLSVSVVLWHGRSCQEMCGTILWVGKQNDSTTLQSINSMLWRPSLQRRRIEIRGRIVQKYALKIFWNAYSWHALDDPIFCGQWRNLHDQLLKGPKHVTNDCLVWLPTFITQCNTNNIVMWETLQNSADWDCFKTPTLQEILRTQNPLQVEHCAFSVGTRLFQLAGCARNKLQFRAAQQNQKSFPWMQV